MAHRVFLSYRRADRKLTEALVNTLKTHGMHVWWDDDIEGGENWREAIVDNLDNSDMFVILFSEAANGSKELKKELAVAESMDKLIVPVLIEDTKPKGHYLYELQHRNWIQIHPEPASKLERLVEKLSAIADRIPAGVAIPPAPAEPTANARPPDPPAAAPGMPVPEAARADASRAVERIKEVPIDFPPTEAPVSPSGPPPGQGTGASVQAAKRPPSAPDQPVPQAMQRPIRTDLPAEAGRGFIRDIPSAFPFRRFDAYVFAVIAVLALAMGAVEGKDLGVVVFAVLSGAYFVLVFPFRHYQRQVRPKRAAWLFGVSACVPAVVLGIAASLSSSPAAPGGAGVGIVIGIFFLALIVACEGLLYGVLFAQRALRNFRSNVEQL